MKNNADTSDDGGRVEVESTEDGNAHLIAAAPELYKALKLAKTHLEQAREIAGIGFPSTMHTINAALAKARGEE